MRLKFLAILGLIVLCSSSLALKMNEEIEVEGYGILSAQTEQTSVYDRLFGYGEDQAYSRKLTSGDYEQASLETAYTYRNSKSIEGINVSGRYEAGLRVPDGVRHTIWVKSNDSIDTASAMSYECGDLIIGKSYFDWKARNANLSERLSGMGGDTMASTDIQGNFSLFNELEENQRMYCTVGVLKEMLEAVEMRGSNQVQEVRVQGPKTIIMEGKAAPADVQASYLQKDAMDLINGAILQDEMKRREALNGALVLIDKALVIYPNDAVGWMNKGTALDYLNRTQDAIEAYKKAASLDNTNPDILFALGELLFNAKNYMDSIHYLKMGLDINPYREDGNYWLAQAYYYLGDWSDAEMAIDKHLSLNGGDSESWLFKAVIQYQNQSYQEAVVSYEKGLSMLNLTMIDESNAMDFEKLGIAYFEIGKTDKAIENLGKASSLFTSLKDKERANDMIRYINQTSAGSSPKEISQNGPLANSAIPSSMSEPANVTVSAASVRIGG